jgi:8-oxo-dGTP pyrophosphatase MutT (NUDIX family)
MGKKEKNKEQQEYQKVQVWIHGLDQSGRRFVLLFRTNEKRGGFWQPVTGKVETTDRSLAEAALREASEESGLLFPALPRPIGFEFSFVGKWGKAHETVFELELPTHQVGRTEILKLDPQEHQEARWVVAQECESLIAFDSNKEALVVLLGQLKRRSSV